MEIAVQLEVARRKTNGARPRGRSSVDVVDERVTRSERDKKGVAGVLDLSLERLEGPERMKHDAH